MNDKHSPEQTKMDAIEQIKQQKMIREAPYYECEQCGEINFIEIVRYKRISGLLDGSGTDKRVGLPLVACASCGTVPKEFIEKIEVQEEKSKIIS